MNWYKVAKRLSVQHPRYMKQSMDVILNPSSAELEMLSGDAHTVRMFVGDNEIIAWPTYNAAHAIVAEMMPEFECDKMIPVQAGVDDGKIVWITITDFAARTPWGNNPQTKEALMNNSLFSYLSETDDTSYYNEDVIGDWENLEGNNDELV